MPFRALLTHTVDVYKPPSARGLDVRDRLGQPIEASVPTVVSPENQPELTGVKCYLDWVRPTMQMTDRTRGTVVTQPILFMELGVDIHENDFVTVRDETNAPLATFARVTGVTRPRGMRGLHHIEAKLENTRDPEDSTAS